MCNRNEIDSREDKGGQGDQCCVLKKLCKVIVTTRYQCCTAFTARVPRVRVQQICSMALIACSKQLIVNKRLQI